MKKIQYAVKKYMEKYGAQFAAAALMMGGNLNVEMIKNLSERDRKSVV